MPKHRRNKEEFLAEAIHELASGEIDRMAFVRKVSRKFLPQKL